MSAKIEKLYKKNEVEITELKAQNRNKHLSGKTQQQSEDNRGQDQGT